LSASPGNISVYGLSCAGGRAQAAEEDVGLSRGSGVCKWFNVRMGFGFLSMYNRDGVPLQQPLDVFVHQVRCCCFDFSFPKRGFMFGLIVPGTG